MTVNHDRIWLTVHVGLDRDSRRYFCFDGDNRVFVESKKTNHNVTSSNTIYLSNEFSDNLAEFNASPTEKNRVDDVDDDAMKINHGNTSQEGAHVDHGQMKEDASASTTPTSIVTAPSRLQLTAIHTNRAMKKLISSKPAMKKTSW